MCTGYRIKEAHGFMFRMLPVMRETLRTDSVVFCSVNDLYEAILWHIYECLRFTIVRLDSDSELLVVGITDNGYPTTVLDSRDVELSSVLYGLDAFEIKAPCQDFHRVL